MWEYLPGYRSDLDIRLVSGIDGWLSTKEMHLLYRLAQRCTGRGAIVEIGSWKGKSTACLAFGSRVGAKTPVTAIDPFTGSPEHGDVFTLPEFERNIDRLGIAPLVRVIPKTSHDAAEGWNEPIELLWIDGAHELPAVREDFALWSPHLIEGGTIAFHDSPLPGPKAVIEEYLYRGKQFHAIRFVHGITYARKGRGRSILNRGMMLLRDLAYLLWRVKRFVRPSQKRG